MIRWLHRHPIPIVVLILCGFAAGAWFAHDYVENTLRPREAAARRAKIAEDIAAGDTLRLRHRWAPATRQYRFVLRAYGEELSVETRGAIWQHIGESQRQEGLRRREKEPLEQARQALGEAIKLRPRETAPAPFAESEAELGRVFAALHEVTDEPGALGHAIEAWRRALDATPREQAPEAYASLWLQIGNARREQASAAPAPVGTNGARQTHGAPAFGDLKSAMDAYAEALHVFTPQAYPLQYAQTQIERGATLLVLARRTAPNRNAALAMKALKEALDFVERKKRPRVFGTAQKLLGDTYTLLAAHPPSSLPANWAYQHRYRNESLARLAYELAEQSGVSRGTEAKALD